MASLIDDSSILMSIKHLLNIDPEEMAFDNEIGMFINGEFMTLNQLGIGPESFSIHEADTKWTDFSTDKTLIETVKTYIYLRVRLLFDPPASSIVSDAINQRISELQFRLNCQAERNWTDDSEDSDGNQNGSGSNNGTGSEGGNHNGGSSGYYDGPAIVIEGENLTVLDHSAQTKEGG